MGKIMLFGLIHEDHPNLWKNTKLLVNRGLIATGNETYVLPSGLDSYLSDRADSASNISSSLSPNQKNKVKQYAKDNKDKMVNSEIFNAIQQDFKLFGDAAFKEE